MATKKGKQTIVFAVKPVIIGYSTVAGPKEGQGPVGPYFDKIYPDLAMGQKSFEKAERQMMLNAIDTALEKASLSRSNIDYFVAGDLLNQIISSGFS
ncbi:MAG TPA: stage V sporulation protein AD, partial [Firmicutes bacterium]|nr:stage V sporulation protein AD [Bacillota bacterium]